MSSKAIEKISSEVYEQFKINIKQNKIKLSKDQKDSLKKKQIKILQLKKF